MYTREITNEAKELFCNDYKIYFDQQKNFDQ